MRGVDVGSPIAMRLPTMTASQEHAVLVDLFRAAPRLALDLLRALGTDVPDDLEATVVESTFQLAVPDRHVDVAITCGHSADEPALIILTEVQLDTDDAKRFSWPHYEAAARARWRCEACVLVLTVDERVATWAATPVRVGPSGSVFRAVVIGPRAMPRLGPDEIAAHPPELALLSALAHGGDDDALLVSTLESLESLDEERAAAYLDLLRYKFGDALERALEELMTTAPHKYLSDVSRKQFADGIAIGKRSALETFLTSRGLELTPEQRARIDACDDPTRLDEWIARAGTAASVSDVLRD
jgi:hypothetical protein